CLQRMAIPFLAHVGVREAMQFPINERRQAFHGFCVTRTPGQKQFGYVWFWKAFHNLGYGQSQSTKVFSLISAPQRKQVAGRSRPYSTREPNRPVRWSSTKSNGTSASGLQASQAVSWR